MKRTISLLAVAALGVAMAGPAWAASDAECQDLWKKADANADGVLSDNESVRYVALMRIGGKNLTMSESHDLPLKKSEKPEGLDFASSSRLLIVTDDSAKLLEMTVQRR